jgi:hypothetical protein
VGTSASQVITGIASATSRPRPSCQRMTNSVSSSRITLVSVVQKPVNRFTLSLRGRRLSFACYRPDDFFASIFCSMVVLFACCSVSIFSVR